MIRVLGFSHVNVEVVDVDRALGSYRLFGLREIERAGASARRGAWLVLPDGSEIHLVVGSPPAPTRAHFAIFVEDLAAARQAVESHGAPIEMERDLPGSIRFFTRDPDGNRLEIVQRLS